MSFIQHSYSLRLDGAEPFACGDAEGEVAAIKDDDKLRLCAVEQIINKASRAERARYNANEK